MFNAGDFYKYVDGLEEASFAEKSMIKGVVAEYLSKCEETGTVSDDKSERRKRYEAWLDSRFTWAKNDISRGLSTATYNSLCRAHNYDSETRTSTSVFKTNRDLLDASDDFIASYRNLSKNKVKEIREYLEKAKERILSDDV